MIKIKMDVNQAIMGGAIFAAVAMAVGTFAAVYSLYRVDAAASQLYAVQQESVLAAKIISTSAFTLINISYLIEIAILHRMDFLHCCSARRSLCRQQH